MVRHLGSARSVEQRALRWIESTSIAFQTASGTLVARRNDRGIELRLPGQKRAEEL